MTLKLKLVTSVETTNILRSVPKQTWNQSISAKKSPSHLLDLGKIKPLYVGQFKQPLVLAKLKSRLKWASRNSITRCPIWPLVLAQHWANTGLESPISPVLYKNNARGLLSRILSILNLDWLQHARSVRGVYECPFKDSSRLEKVKFVNNFPLGYLKNHCTNTRLVCTHLYGRFFSVNFIPLWEWMWCHIIFYVGLD